MRLRHLRVNRIRRNFISPDDFHRAKRRIKNPLSAVIETRQLFVRDALDQFLRKPFGDQIGLPPFLLAAGADLDLIGTLP